MLEPPVIVLSVDDLEEMAVLPFKHSMRLLLTIPQTEIFGVDEAVDEVEEAGKIVTGVLIVVDEAVGIFLEYQVEVWIVVLVEILV